MIASHPILILQGRVTVNLRNHFSYRVDLYWLHPETKARQLVESDLESEFPQTTSLGHLFEVVKQSSGEVVHAFEIAEDVNQYSFGEEL